MVLILNFLLTDHILNFVFFLIYFPPNYTKSLKDIGFYI